MAVDQPSIMPMDKAVLLKQRGGPSKQIVRPLIPFLVAVPRRILSRDLISRRAGE